MLLTRAIPSSGEQIPVIGLGTWQTFNVGSGDVARLEPVLQTFAALGGTLVDSSPMYGRAEIVVGELATRLRLHPQLFIATKVWTTGERAGIQQMEISIERLRVQKIDLMQVHNLVDVDVHLKTLHQWKDEGRIRYVGVTHYTASGHASIVRLLQSEAVDFVQINYSVAEREAERHILPLAQERGIAVLINRPFTEGGLMRRLRGRPVPGWAGEIGCESWAELLLKFVISHPAVTCVIPATSNVEHLRANLRAGTGTMPDQELRMKILGAIE